MNILRQVKIPDIYFHNLQPEGPSGENIGTESSGTLVLCENPITDQVEWVTPPPQLEPLFRVRTKWMLKHKYVFGPKVRSGTKKPWYPFASTWVSKQFLLSMIDSASLAHCRRDFFLRMPMHVGTYYNASELQPCYFLDDQLAMVMAKCNPSTMPPPAAVEEVRQEVKAEDTLLQQDRHLDVAYQYSAAHSPPAVSPDLIVPAGGMTVSAILPKAVPFPPATAADAPMQSSASAADASAFDCTISEVAVAEQDFLADHQMTFADDENDAERCALTAEVEAASICLDANGEEVTANPMNLKNDADPSFADAELVAEAEEVLVSDRELEEDKLSTTAEDELAAEAHADAFRDEASNDVEERDYEDNKRIALATLQAESNHRIVANETLDADAELELEVMARVEEPGSRIVTTCFRYFPTVPPSSNSKLHTAGLSFLKESPKSAFSPQDAA